jgi:membrane protease YdiL (CAAX protease family)
MASLAVFLGAVALHTVVSHGLFRLSLNLGLVLAEPVAILLPTLLVVKRAGWDPRETLRLRAPSTTDALLALPLAVSLAVLSDQVSTLSDLVFPMPEWVRRSMASVMTASSPVDWLARLAGVGLGAAVSEEILFRGFIQTGLARRWGAPVSIALGSVAFAAIHMNPWGFLSFTLAGLVLGIAAHATGSILVPILIHLGNNVAAVLLLNLGGRESLGNPVWIPPLILVPSFVGLVAILSYFITRENRGRRRMSA